MRIIERPTRQTERSFARAASQADCTRATLEAKEVIATRARLFRHRAAQRLARHAFGAGLAFLEHVGRVAHHGEDALAPQLLDLRLIEVLADDRIGIDLPVACVQDQVRAACGSPGRWVREWSASASPARLRTDRTAASPSAA